MGMLMLSTPVSVALIGMPQFCLPCQVRVYIDPTVILVSTRIDDRVIDCLDPESKSGGSVGVDNDQFRLPFLLQVRPPNEFSYESAKNKLASLHLGNENGTHIEFNIPGELATVGHPNQEHPVSQQGHLLRLSGWINLESRSTVLAHCAISYLSLRLNRLAVLGHSYCTCNADALLPIFPVIVLQISCFASQN